MAKQREQYRLLQQGKHSFLTPDRLQALNEIGFVWHVQGPGRPGRPAKAEPSTPKPEEEEVAVVPGDAFGQSGAGFVRACYATSYEKLEEALNRLERFMKRHG